MVITGIPILQNQAVHLMLFTQQKSYHFYKRQISVRLERGSFAS